MIYGETSLIMMITDRESAICESIDLDDLSAESIVLEGEELIGEENDG